MWELTRATTRRLACRAARASIHSTEVAPSVRAVDTHLALSAASATCAMPAFTREQPVALRRAPPAARACIAQIHPSSAAIVEPDGGAAVRRPRAAIARPVSMLLKVYRRAALRAWLGLGADLEPRAASPATQGVSVQRAQLGALTALPAPTRLRQALHFAQTAMHWVLVSRHHRKHQAATCAKRVFIVRHFRVLVFRVLEMPCVIFRIT